MRRTTIQTARRATGRVPVPTTSTKRTKKIKGNDNEKTTQIDQDSLLNLSNDARIEDENLNRYSGPHPLLIPMVSYPTLYIF